MRRAGPCERGRGRPRGARGIRPAYGGRGCPSVVIAGGPAPRDPQRKGLMSVSRRSGSRESTAPHPLRSIVMVKPPIPWPGRRAGLLLVGLAAAFVTGATADAQAERPMPPPAQAPAGLVPTLAERAAL